MSIDTRQLIAHLDVAADHYFTIKATSPGGTAETQEFFIAVKCKPVTLALEPAYFFQVPPQFNDLVEFDDLTLLDDLRLKITSTLSDESICPLDFYLTETNNG